MQFRCRILIDNFSVDGEKKDNIMYSWQNGDAESTMKEEKDIFVTFPLATVSVPACVYTVIYR
jgi:hypothetical protein